MRTILLFFLIFVSWARPPVLCGQADSTTFKRLQFGLVGGQYNHDIDFTPNAAVVTLPDLRYGLALRYFDKQLVGFQAEVTYEGAGWQENIQELPERYERRTDYVDVQILTQFSVGRGLVQPMLQAGPFISFPIAEEEVIPAGYDPELAPENAYYGRELDWRVNYGLRAGVGLNFEIGRATLQIEGRYLQGFSDLIRPGVTQATTSRREAYGVQFGLFYAVN